MDLKNFNAYCASLPVTTHVVQWGGADVWKVGGKVFAFGRPGDGSGGDSREAAIAFPAITFKVSELSFEILQQQPGLRPAPYLASRGLSWIQHYAKPGLSDAELRDYLAQSHRLVVAGLSKKKRRELGLDPAS